MFEKLGADFFDEIAACFESRRFCLFKKLFQFNGRDQKADLVAGGGDIYTYNPAFRWKDGPAAHAWVDRAGEMNFLPEGVLEKAVIGSFYHGQPEVVWVA